MIKDKYCRNCDAILTDDEIAHLEGLCYYCDDEEKGEK